MSRIRQCKEVACPGTTRHWTTGHLITRGRLRVAADAEGGQAPAAVTVVAAAATVAARTGAGGGVSSGGTSVEGGADAFPPLPPSSKDYPQQQ